MTTANKRSDDKMFPSFEEYLRRIRNASEADRTIVKWKDRLEQMRAIFEDVSDRLEFFDDVEQFREDWEYMFEVFVTSVDWDDYTSMRLRCND